VNACGVAVAISQGTAGHRPPRTVSSGRGNHREAPESSSSTGGVEFGLTRRLSMATWWGGGAVVVRAGESLVHGEGPQRN
jgi:hypothetical protein